MGAMNVAASRLSLAVLALIGQLITLPWPAAAADTGQIM
jgi:hypothetical protein